MVRERKQYLSQIVSRTYLLIGSLGLLRTQTDPVMECKDTWLLNASPENVILCQAQIILQKMSQQEKRVTQVSLVEDLERKGGNVGADFVWAGEMKRVICSKIAEDIFQSEIQIGAQNDWRSRHSFLAQWDH